MHFFEIDISHSKNTVQEGLISDRSYHLDVGNCGSIMFEVHLTTARLRATTVGTRKRAERLNSFGSGEGWTILISIFG